MERTLSPEEKIRRAEEIYNRRRNQQVRTTVATVKVSDEKKYGLFKKMILQILICLVIYFIFHLIQSSNYIFSEDVINKAKEILSYDVNFQSMYQQFVEFVNTQINGNVEKEEESDNEQKEENQNNTTQEVNNEAIGGADLGNIIMEGIEVANQKEEIKEETNEEYIKNNFSFIKPVEGVVSSEFGPRTSNNPQVSKNHAGIDIAANTGTSIVAAMDGTVILDSTTGDYGYHLKIENQDVITLYAHCSKLLVKQGDTVTKGQKIAEVGETGKAFGAHLHFEIIRGNTYINPRSVLEF
ncbi:MAG: M23 family metallopeptidase [Clostridia bacterium]|nr:M23 family metallopeptidase [Clostridia bacterium]